MQNSAMYNALLKFYKNGLINENSLQRAVKKGLITYQESIEIVGKCATNKIS